jgi:hypothetical protein
VLKNIWQNRVLRKIFGRIGCREKYFEKLGVKENI